MLLKILQLIFCVTPLVLSLILYKKPYRFMAKFHASMKQNIRARKLYTRVILFLLLLFHYVYASGHAGEFGILVSTVICAAMFSFKLADRCLSRLHDSMGLFAGISAITLVSCFEPYLYTTFFWQPCSIPLLRSQPNAMMKKRLKERQRILKRYPKRNTIIITRWCL